MWLIVWLERTALHNSPPFMRGIIQSLTIKVTSFSFNISIACPPSSAVRILYWSEKLFERKDSISLLSSTISITDLCLAASTGRASDRISFGRTVSAFSALLSCSPISAHSIGKITTKEEPLPTTDCTSMLPLWASTMLFTMLSPSPVPGLLSTAW